MIDDDILLQVNSARNSIRTARGLDGDNILLDTRYPSDRALVGAVNGVLGHAARAVIMDRRPDLRGKERESAIRSYRLRALNLLLAGPMWHEISTTANTLTASECRGILDWSTESIRTYTGTEPVYAENPGQLDPNVQTKKGIRAEAYNTLYALMVRPELATAIKTLPGLER